MPRRFWLIRQIRSTRRRTVLFVQSRCRAAGFWSAEVSSACREAIASAGTANYIARLHASGPMAGLPMISTERAQRSRSNRGAANGKILVGGHFRSSNGIPASADSRAITSPGSTPTDWLMISIRTRKRGSCDRGAGGWQDLSGRSFSSIGNSRAAVHGAAQCDDRID